MKPDLPTKICGKNQRMPSNMEMKVLSFGTSDIN